MIRIVANAVLLGGLVLMVWGALNGNDWQTGWAAVAAFLGSVGAQQAGGER